jgi:hypothetical protein
MGFYSQVEYTVAEKFSLVLSAIDFLSYILTIFLRTNSPSFWRCVSLSLCVCVDKIGVKSENKRKTRKCFSLSHSLSLSLSLSLQKRCAIAPSYCKRLVSVMKELQTARKHTQLFEGKQGYITLR